jgi:hypothetical protein
VAADGPREGGLVIELPTELTTVPDEHDVPDLRNDAEPES